MQFLSAWAEAGTPTLIQVLAVPALLAVAAFVPGRPAARGIALLLALLLPALGGIGLPAGIRWGWALLWLLVAWRVGLPLPARRPDRDAARPGGIESGTIGLLLTLALLALMIAAVARHHLDADATRRSSYGLLLVATGMLHLMLRRDALRGLLAFGALGLGLQVLHGAAHDVLLPAGAEQPEVVLAGAAVALALVERVARVRQAAAGSPWVSDAHDLHD